MEERANLTAAVDQFEKDDIAQAEDTVLALPDSSRRKGSDYVRQLRQAAAALRSREFEPTINADKLLERYRLSEIEQDITGSKPK